MQKMKLTYVSEITDKKDKEGKDFKQIVVEDENKKEHRINFQKMTENLKNALIGKEIDYLSIDVRPYHYKGKSIEISYIILPKRLLLGDFNG